MTLALIEKEIRQHGSMIFLFWILIVGGMFMLRSSELLSGIGGSGFFFIAWILFLLFPLVSLVLGNALIATEFRQKTQIFLDGLPMPRWKMVAVKYFCGLTVAELTALLPLLLTSAIGWDQEAMNLSFMMLLVTRTALWAWFCWAAIFPFSLLGRYRLIVGVIVVLGLTVAQNVGDVPVNRFGPFDMVSDQFAYERVVYPIKAIWITVGLIILLTAAGFAMSLARDATLATMLSEKMSSREKMVMIALGIATLMIVSSLAERSSKTDPLNLPDSIDVANEQAAISIAAAVAKPTEAEREAMQLHAQANSELLQEVAKFLGIKKLPTLFLVHRRDLNAGEFEDGEIDSRQGCVVRLNVLKTKATDSAYQSRIIEKLLDVNQHNRLSSDSRGWILEGFAYWWPRRNLSPMQYDLPSGDESDSMLTSHRIAVDDLNKWKKFRKSLPDGDAGSFAGKNIEALWSKNEEGCRAFLSATLGYSAPHDVRATIHDYWFNVPAMTRKHLSLSQQELIELWNKADSVEVHKRVDTANSGSGQ